MSQKETTDAIRHLVGVSPQDNLRKLAVQARGAYEQRRKKDCLDLARAILSIDPHHETAQWMLSSIESEMQRDLEKARASRREPRAFRRHRLVLAAGVLIVLGVVMSFYFFLSRPNTVDTSRVINPPDFSKVVEETNSGTPLPRASEQVLAPNAPQLIPAHHDSSLVNPPTSIPAAPVPPGRPAKKPLVSRDPVLSVTSPVPRKSAGPRTVNKSLAAVASSAATPVAEPRSSERERTPDLLTAGTQQQSEVIQRLTSERPALPPQATFVGPDKAPDSTASSERPSTAEPAGPTSGQPTVLTNSDILYLVKAHLSTEVITALIQSSRPNFETTPAALADLKAANVPEPVILAMLQTARSKFAQ